MLRLASIAEYCTHAHTMYTDELHAENAALKVRVDSMESEIKEERARNEELLQHNAQLEVDKESW